MNPGKADRGREQKNRWSTKQKIVTMSEAQAEQTIFDVSSNRLQSALLLGESEEKEQKEIENEERKKPISASDLSTRLTDRKREIVSRIEPMRKEKEEQEGRGRIRTRVGSLYSENGPYRHLMTVGRKMHVEVETKGDTMEVVEQTVTPATTWSSSASPKTSCASTEHIISPRTGSGGDHIFDRLYTRGARSLSPPTKGDGPIPRSTATVTDGVTTPINRRLNELYLEGVRRNRSKPLTEQEEKDRRELNMITMDAAEFTFHPKTCWGGRIDRPKIRSIGTLTRSKSPVRVCPNTPKKTFRHQHRQSIMSPPREILITPPSHLGATEGSIVEIQVSSPGWYSPPRPVRRLFSPPPILKSKSLPESTSHRVKSVGVQTLRTYEDEILSQILSDSTESDSQTNGAVSADIVSEDTEYGSI